MKHPQWDLQPAVTQLSPEQQWQLVEDLKKVGWQRTGKDIFEAILFPIFPAVPSECAIVREINQKPHVLLWHRDDEFYKGYHMPGKYLLRGEDDESWIRRTISTETGLTLKRFEFIRRFNTRPETGWVPGQQIAHFWYCEVEGEPINGKFYPLTVLPEDTLGHHKKYVEYLRAFLMRRETMRTKGIWHDGRHHASEWKWVCARTLFFPESNESYNDRHEFDSFDEALTGLQELKKLKAALPYHLFDDLGQQIV